MIAAIAIVVRALTIALMFRMAWKDFKTQKITNADVMALGCLGTSGLLLAAIASGSWWNLQVGAAAAVVMFLALFPFWLMRKVGAGDVKLMAAAPLVAGADNLFPFSLLLLVFAALTAFLVKNPLLLPAPAFRHYLEHLDRKGVVPFGVPISASLIGVLLLATFSHGVP
jgi:prepilin peptidase CpaA